MKERLTFKRAFELTVEQWKDGVIPHLGHTNLTIDQLKKVWLEKKFPGERVEGSCFLCEYKRQREIEEFGYPSNICIFCPSKIVDRNFDCRNERYCWFEMPITFYNKLRDIYAEATQEIIVGTDQFICPERCFNCPAMEKCADYGEYLSDAERRQLGLIKKGE